MATSGLHTPMIPVAFLLKLRASTKGAAVVMVMLKRVLLALL